MAIQDKLMINDIDVTEYRLKWKFNSVWLNAIDVLEIEFTSSIREILNLEVGSTVRLTRGRNTPEDEVVFIGQITSVEPMYDKTEVSCKSRLFDAIKNGRTKSWDKNIDISNGIGSEIFKEICEHSQLDFTPAIGDFTDGSIHFTGDNDLQKINKFVQNDEDDFEKMKQIAELYNFIISYDYENELVIFKPKGYETYPISLVVGEHIPGQIKWEESIGSMINKLKIQGGTVLDRVVQTFTGPDTIFNLSKTPEDSEVRINRSTTNDLMVRGQKGARNFGTDYDYYIDKETRTLIFANDVSDVWINYSAQVPLVLILRNETSINEYGGPNKVPHYKKLVFNDLKDLEDAEMRGREILDKYSMPFISADDIPIFDEVLKENGNIKVGHLINIQDNFNNRDVNVFVSEIEKSWPHVYDRITIGDEVWRTEEFQARQMELINQLLNELNRNQDIIYQNIDSIRTAEFQRRYLQVDKNSTTIFLGQGGRTYKELFYDTDFFDDVASDPEVSWNVIDRQLVIPENKTFYSKSIEINSNRTEFTLNFGEFININDNVFKIEITHNNSDWQIVTQGVKSLFPEPSTDIRIRITNEGP